MLLLQGPGRLWPVASCGNRCAHPARPALPAGRQGCSGQARLQRFLGMPLFQSHTARSAPDSRGAASCQQWELVASGATALSRSWAWGSRAETAVWEAPDPQARGARIPAGIHESDSDSAEPKNQYRGALELLPLGAQAQGVRNTDPGDMEVS